MPTFRGAVPFRQVAIHHKVQRTVQHALAQSLSSEFFGLV